MPWEVKGYSGGCGERGDEIKGKRRKCEMESNENHFRSDWKELTGGEKKGQDGKGR